MRNKYFYIFTLTLISPLSVNTMEPTPKKIESWQKWILLNKKNIKSPQEYEHEEKSKTNALILAISTEIEARENALKDQFTAVSKAQKEATIDLNTILEEYRQQLSGPLQFEPESKLNSLYEWLRKKFTEWDQKHQV